MSDALWTWAALREATGGVLDNADVAPAGSGVCGVSIDTRTLVPGDLFVALVDQRDGHDFVTQAFAHGAGAALVRADYPRRDGDGVLVRVTDPLIALTALAVAARQRLASEARVVAVTGSAGKTGTKEMLRACLGQLGRVHASEKSYNNHWGVPLTLARMPADTDFAVIEIGMNHADEIRPLTKLARPHAAIVTTVEAVHIENFPSVEAIADAKAEIFEGLVPGGPALIKHDNPHRDRLIAAARRCHAEPRTFGFNPAADVVGTDLVETATGAAMTVATGRDRYAMQLAMPGRHLAENALAVVGAIDALDLDAASAITALASAAPPPGRGQRLELACPGGTLLLIDESYNANPASMRAALATLARVPRDKFPRRVVVVGDMLELGSDAAKRHVELVEDIVAAGVDAVFACGPLSRGLFDALPDGLKAGYASVSKELEPILLSALRQGDVVMIKASNGTRLGVLVEAIKSNFAPAG